MIDLSMYALIARPTQHPVRWPKFRKIRYASPPWRSLFWNACSGALVTCVLVIVFFLTAYGIRFIDQQISYDPEYKLKGEAVFAVAAMAYLLVVGSLAYLVAIRPMLRFNRRKSYEREIAYFLGSRPSMRSKGL